MSDAPNFARMAFAVWATLVLVSSAVAAEPVVSELKDDETLVFFRTSGWLDQEAQTWQLPIHGWVYEPQDSRARKGAFAKALEDGFGLEAVEGTQANFDRRVNLMIADNERGKQMVIRIGGDTHILPESGENGHFKAVISVPAAEAAQIVKHNVVRYSAVMSSDDPRSFTGEVQLVPPTGMSVISDIDDTIKITAVTDHTKLLDYTFFRDFEAVPGMAKLYQDWSKNQAAIHLVSSSPWQLYSPLLEFTHGADFPWVSFSLKTVRLRDETLLDVFKPGTATKPLQIKPLLARYPGRRFVLVGDSGEQDPEVYAALFREYPDQIAAIYIRNITNSRRDDVRFAAVFAGIPDERWQLFIAPSMLP